MSPKVVVNQSNMKVVVNKNNNTVEVTSPGPQGNFYNSYKGNWSSATAYILGDIVFYNGSSYVAIANNTNSQPPSANWSAVAKGIPGGGTTGQIIVKNSSTDYDYSWTNNYTINTTSPLTGGAAINTNPTLAINATANDTANYVVQRDANQSFSIGAVRFDTSSVQTSAVGKLYWDGNETLNLGLGSTGTVTIAVGQEVINYVTNAEATTLNVGEVVYLFGAQGDRPSVKRASNASDATSAKTFGIVAESITAGGAGFVINKGIVSKVNTSAYNPGDILWLGATPGTFTTTKPVAPAHLVFVGVVLRSNAGNGLVYVSPQNGYELEEIHDVLITSPTDGQFLTYESSTDLWKNKGISATAPITYNAGTRTIAANAASTSASGVVQLTDSTSSTSTTTAATPNSVKTAYDLAAAAIPLSQKAAANGVATLDASGLVPTNQLPALAITNTFVVASQAAMLALTAETGDVAIRTDLNKSFILTATPASTLANWQELLTPPDAVTSVDGRVGAVTLSDLYAARGTTISTTAPLAGGGDLSANRTLSIADASTTVKGAVQLTDSISSTSTTTAATPNSVKTAYDLAAAATPATRTISTTAPLAGGGDLSANRTLSLNIGSSLTTSASNLIVDSTIVPYLANANTFTAAQTATSFIVTGSTVPTNGMYLPTTNTLGFATNGTFALGIGSTGNVYVGGTANAFTSIRLGKNMTGGVNAFGVGSRGTIQSDVTSTVASFYSSPDVVAASFTLTNLYHAWASQGSIGAGATVTNQMGYIVDNTLIGATNNFGFYGNIPSGTNRWNVYMSGTAANYFAGQTTVGSTSLTLGSGSVAQQFGVVAGAATTVGAVIRGAASQTANLTEWQNSAGSILTRIGSAGDIIVATTAAVYTNGVSNVSSSANAYLELLTTGPRIGVTSASNVALTIKNNNATPGPDLLQLTDASNNVLNSIDNSGNIRSEAQLIQYGAEGSLIQNIPTRVHPAETLLKQAVWWIDAAHTSASSQTINNLGWGGSALNVTNGSSTSADSNDAQYLAWDGVNYVYTPGSNNNILSVPDSNALDIIGDIDIRAQIAMDDWTPSALSEIVSKFASSSRSYALVVNTDGTLRFYWTTDGSTNIFRSSTVAPTVTDGTALWIRAVLDVNNGASGHDVLFYTSTNGTTWTQLGTTVTTAGTTSIFAGTSDIGIGGNSGAGASMMAGKIYRAQILNGIDGVPVLDVDTSVIASGSATSFTALTGQTVTVNRSTSGRKTVCVTNPLWLFGTDDYMEVNNRWLEHTGSNYLYLPGVNGNYCTSPDSAALSITGDIDIRVKVALDDWTPAAETCFISKMNGGYSYRLNILTNGQLIFGFSTDGTNFFTGQASTATGVTDGATKWVRATRVASTGVITFFLSDDGSTWTQLGNTATATTGNLFDGTGNLEIGSWGVGVINIARGKFFRAQVLNGIGGTVAFDANFETGITSNLPTTFTESSANAATVTVNYSGTGYRSAGVIASTYVYPGNPNTFKLSTTSLLDFGASDSFTMFGAVRLFGNAGSGNRVIFAKQISPNTEAGYILATNARVTNAFLRDNTNSITDNSGVTAADNSLISMFGIANRSTNLLTTFTNTSGDAGTSISTITGSTFNPNRTFMIGRYNDGSPSDMELVGAAIWRRVLTAAEIATLNNYFQGRVA